MRAAILLFTAGVLCLQWQATLPDPVVLAICAGAGCLGLGVRGLLARTHVWAMRGVLLCACALLGFAWAGARAQWRLDDFLPEDWQGRDIPLVGVIASLPQPVERGERFAFDVEETIATPARVPRRLLLSWYHFRNGGEEMAQPLHPGERWRFTVRLRRPHGSANPHGFDYEAWLLERGYRATGTVRAREEAVRLDAFVWRPAYLVEWLREKVRQRFLDNLPEAPYAGVLIALAVGDQRAIPNAQWEIFRRTGITHLVSISGLHVTMVAALCALLVNFLWRRCERLMLYLPAQKAAIAAGWLAALSYSVLAGFEVPAQRTLYMLSAVAFALWSGRNPGITRTLLLALLTVLFIDPWAVLAVGFWLSFGAVALLFFVSASRIGQRDVDSMNPRDKVATFSARLRRWRTGLWQWGAAQWAVTLGCIPLLLLFFQQFSLVSPLANAVAIPVVSFAVTPLALIYAVFPWGPILQFDHALLAQLMNLLEFFAGWPVWTQPSPPFWTVPLALTGIVWLLLPRGFPARWLGLCLLAPILLMRPERPPLGEAWVDTLDVGQGLAVLVRTAEHTLLYDTGPRYGSGPEASDAGQRVVTPLLRAIGVDQLDTLVVSHRDQDHSGGLDAVRAHGPIARFLTSMPDVGGEACVDRQTWEWDGIRFTLLHPLASDYTSKKTKRPNGMSCVLRIQSGGASLLLTGDIETTDERALVARAARELRSDVLVVPHHGGRGSSSPGFVEAVAPREAIFSAGYYNPFGHPRPEVLARYANARHWRTDRQGAIHIVLGASDVQATAWRETHPRYWH